MSNIRLFTLDRDHKKKNIRLKLNQYSTYALSVFAYSRDVVKLIIAQTQLSRLPKALICQPDGYPEKRTRVISIYKVYLIIM